ncbi:MAG: adenylate/guanylate cyclase domain-containing protein [Candidatus Ozemobacteraceae bacterium]
MTHAVRNSHDPTFADPGRFGRLIPFLFVGMAALLFLVGRNFVGDQKRQWAFIDVEERAGHLLEGLSAGYGLPRQIERVGRQFSRALAERERVRANGRDVPELRDLFRASFAAPFPEHELWVFGYDRNRPAALPEILQAPLASGMPRRVPSMIFANIVSRSRGKTPPPASAESAKKMTESFFGHATEIDLLAGPQHGFATLVLYKKKQHWFFWDVVLIDGKPTTGFWLLVPVFDGFDRAGLALGAHAFSSSAPLCAFVSLFPRAGRDALSPGLAKSRTFAHWQEEWRTSNRLRRIEQNGPPWSIALGNRLLFAQTVPNGEHLAVVLLPKPRSESFSLPLTAVLVILVCSLAAFGLRAFLLGRGQTLSLKGRFLLLFLAAAGFPLGLAWWTGRAYVIERRGILYQQLQNRLMDELGRVDQGKELVQCRYLETFLRAIDHRPFLDRLASGGIAAPGLIESVASVFSGASPSLPLTYLAVFDAFGGAPATFPSAALGYDMSGSMAFYRSLLCSSLHVGLEARSKDKKNLPPLRLPTEDRILVAVYEGTSGMSAASYASERRGVVEFIQTGRSRLSKIHQYIPIAGYEQYALLAAWTTDALDRLILSIGLETFLSRNPSSPFGAWRIDRDGLVPAISLTREAKRLLLPVARAALARKGPVRNRYARDGLLAMALPSAGLNGTILAGGISLLPVETELAQLEQRLVVLPLLAFMAILYLGRRSGRSVVDPLIRVQRGVEQVTAGDLDIRLGLPDPDELGALSRAFDRMTEGIARRARLSTLVSGSGVHEEHERTSDQGNRSRKTRGVVLTSDLRDFTTLCEHRPVDEITSLLNGHFERMAGIILGRGGRVDKFIGDAVQAVFEEPSGFDKTHQDDPTCLSESAAKRAFGAAVAMIQEIAIINREREANGLFTYRLGVGLASSELVIGVIGDSATRFDLVTMGPAVERSAELEATTKAVPHFPLAIDEAVFQESGDRVRGMVPLQKLVQEKQSRESPNEDHEPYEHPQKYSTDGIAVVYVFPPGVSACD